MHQNVIQSFNSNRLGQRVKSIHSMKNDPFRLPSNMQTRLVDMMLRSKAQQRKNEHESRKKRREDAIK